MTRSSVSRSIVVLAALIGASGVALAAIGAHRPGSENISTAASMMLFNAPAILISAFAAAAGYVETRIGLISASGMILGTLLFSGGLITLDLNGATLVPMMAPAGGILMILSWAALALAAIRRPK